MMKYVSQKRMPKPKGSVKDVCSRNIGVMIKLCLDPSVILPTFCAINLTRIPPVDAEHADISAILRELSSLRHELEVREVMQLRKEVRQLKAMLHSDTPIPATFLQNTVNHDGEADVGVSASANHAGVGLENVRSFAALARDLPSDAFKSQRHTKKPVREPVVGTSTVNNRVSSVVTKRTVDIFVSRLYPLTATSELTDCVDTVKGDLVVHDVVCNKLNAKYSHLYSSYHVSVQVNAGDMKRAIDLFMCSDSWPSGVLIKRFFKPKPNNGQFS